MVQLSTEHLPSRATRIPPTAALPARRRSRGRFAALLALGIVLSAGAGATAALIRPVQWFASPSAAATTAPPVAPPTAAATSRTQPRGYFIEGKGWRAELPPSPDGFTWKHRTNRGQYQSVDVGVQVWHLVADPTMTTTTTTMAPTTTTTMAPVTTGTNGQQTASSVPAPAPG